MVLVKQDMKQQVIDAIYPIGSIYMNATSNKNPSDSSLLGVGTWVQIGQGRMLLGAGTYTETVNNQTQTKTYTAESTGGSKNAVAISHSHRINEQNDMAFCTGTGDGVNNAHLSVQRTSKRAYTSQTNDGIAYLYDKDGSQAMIRSTDSSGESGTDKNMPPYLVVYMWRRTA